jgi:hypothetical protein
MQLACDVASTESRRSEREGVQLRGMACGGAWLCAAAAHRRWLWTSPRSCTTSSCVGGAQSERKRSKRATAETQSGGVFCVVLRVARCTERRAGGAPNHAQPHDDGRHGGAARRVRRALHSNRRALSSGRQRWLRAHARHRRVILAPPRRREHATQRACADARSRATAK